MKKYKERGTALFSVPRSLFVVEYVLPNDHSFF